MAQNKHYYVVREYGVIGEPAPIGPIVAELKRRVELWNALVAIENDIRERIYAATSDQTLLTRIETLKAERKALWAQAIAERKERKAKRVSDEMRAKLKAKREEIASALAAAKAHRAEERKRRKEWLRALEIERRERVAAARQKSGLYWGNYHDVIKDYETARVRAMRDGVALKPHGIRAAGAITAKKTSEPPPVATMLDGRNTWVTILGTERDGCRPLAMGETRKRAIARIRIGSDDARQPVWAEAIVNIHRPLPDGFVRSASFVRRFIGTRPKWTFCVTVELLEAPASSVHSRRITIEAGLQVSQPDGSLLVARCESYECRLPHEYFGALAKTQELIKLVGAKFAAAREQLGLDSDERVNSPGRLYARSIELSRGPASAQREIVAQYKRDYEHLWNWAMHGRDQALRRRRETYRVFAAKVLADAGVYEIVTAPNTPRELGMHELTLALANVGRRFGVAKVANAPTEPATNGADGTGPLADAPINNTQRGSCGVANAVAAQSL